MANEQHRETYLVTIDSVCSRQLHDAYGHPKVELYGKTQSRRILQDMHEVCETIRRLIREHRRHAPGGMRTTPDHSDIYTNVADLLGLWDETNHAPIWLSRVVDGVMRDFAEGEEAD